MITAREPLPVEDVTFCRDPKDDHQRNVMGEALTVDRAAMLSPAKQAAFAPSPATALLDCVCMSGSSSKGWRSSDTPMR